MRWLALALPLVSAVAAENPPTLLLSADLAQPVPTILEGRSYTTKRGWRVLSGKWEFTEGALRGSQLASDGRAGFVVYYQRFTSAVIEFDVKLEGCRQVIFRIQDPIPEHICSVRLTADGFAAQKDDHDHKGPDEAVPFGKASLPIGNGAWKTVRVAIDKETMTTTIEGRTVRGTHPLLATEKATIEFVVVGESASFRNVRMWGGPGN
jgi:hypothetical protein